MKRATITKSIYGTSWKVAYIIGSTIHHEHFETISKAVEFCKKNKFEAFVV